MRLFNKAIFLAAAITLPSFALGQSFDEGLSAAKRGDHATALENWTPLAKQGDALAQAFLGVMYRNGEGVPQNYAKAAEWYRNAAEQGLAAAQYNLGAMYKNGEGVDRNLVVAYVLWNLAAAQGNDDAQHNRDLVVNELSRDQLAEGQRMSTEWREGTPLPTPKDTRTWP